MNKATLNSLFLSIAVLLMSTIGGALIARKLAGGEAGYSFLWFGCIVSLIIFSTQVSTFFNAKKRLYFQLLYFGFFGLSMVWFMLSLGLPVFWANEVGLDAKLIISFIFAVVLFSNIIFGFNSVNKRWSEIGTAAFVSEFNLSKPDINWNKVVKKLSITHNVFIPCVPAKFSSAVSVVLVVFMILGFNLRNAYPVFSVFAWGIPAAVMASYFIQVSGFYFAQAIKVREIEKHHTVIFNSTT